MLANYPSEKITFLDPRTGSRVIKWTSSSATDQSLYFTSPSVTSDHRYLVFISERTGSPNLFSIDRRTGEIVQLTNCKGLLRSYVYPQGGAFGLSKVSPFLDSARNILYWIQDYEVWCCGVGHPKGPSYLANLPKGFVTGYTALSRDGRRLCVPCVDPAAFEETDKSQHEQLNKVPYRMLKQGLSTQLLIINLDTGESHLRAELPFWCTHVQFSPLDDNTLLCNCEGSVGSGGKREYPYWGRVWIVDHDGHFRRLFEQSPGLTVNHENWVSDGSGIIFHGKIAPSGFARLRNVAMRISRRLGICDFNSVDKTYQHYVEARSPQGETLWKVLLDVPVSHAVAITARAFVYDNRIGHIAVCRVKEGGGFETQLLCFHGSSMSNQDSHPHPVPTADRRSVIFSSDLGGSTNVYEVHMD